MYLEQLTKLVRDGASCNLYGCTLLLQIVGLLFKVEHTPGINGRGIVDHTLEFDMTKVGWEMSVVHKAVEKVRGDHRESQS